jgi:hypothetical protein
VSNGAAIVICIISRNLTSLNCGQLLMLHFVSNNSIHIYGRREWDAGSGYINRNPACATL